MSQLKITEMSTASSVNLSDYVPIVQEGINKKVSVEALVGDEVNRVNAENKRVQAEASRVAAEKSRVQFEEQRKRDENIPDYKKTGINSIKTIDGKTIKYSLRDPKERAKYDPVMHIDNKTGEVRFTNKDGSIEYRKSMRTNDTTRMAAVDDAMKLVSPNKHDIELLYADYANSMKALANSARKELISTPVLESNANAKKIYAKEVSSLNARLNEALKNSPKERAVLRLANVEVRAKQKLDPDMKAEDVKKLAQRTVNKYRTQLGTITRKNRAITISDREWEAIQAGAISENKLKKILQYTDTDSLRERAMPTNKRGLGSAQINRIKRLADSNFTLQQIAEKMNISPSLVSKYLKGEN